MSSSPQCMSTHIVALPFTICITSSAFAGICLENQRQECLSMHWLHLVLIIETVFCMGCPNTSLTICRDFERPNMHLGFATSHPLCVVCIGYLLKPRYNLRYCLLRLKQFTALPPKHLCDLLTFKSSLYNLRSSGSILLSMPAVRSKTTLGDRAFMVAEPTLWNSLPKDLRAITNVNSFKAHIKTYLFRPVYWWSILYSVTYLHAYIFFLLLFF